jgi:hypothetical protein
VRFGTRPAGDLLKERLGDERWAELQAEHKFGKSPPAQLVADLFREQPDVKNEVPAICHAVIEVTQGLTGDGPERVGSRVIFLPIAHAELNPIEMLWATLRACRRYFLVETSTAKGHPGVMQQHKRLIASMLASTSPELIVALYRHTARVEDLYRRLGDSSSVMAHVAEGGSRRKSVTQFAWKSHWRPPLQEAMAASQLASGRAADMMAVVHRWGKSGDGEALQASEAFQEGSRCLGVKGDCRQWSGYDVCFMDMIEEVDV